MLPYLFVRRQKDVTPIQANRCSGVIVAVESSRGAMNRSTEWWDGLHCDRMGFLWMPLPGLWSEASTRDAIRFLGSVGASAVVVNAEPRSAKSKPRWEDGHAVEAARYMAVVRKEAERQGMRVGFTSWARLSARPSFPWAPFFDGSEFSITQPYEVHGRTGAAYVEACLAEYRAQGHSDVWCGRGAHELDKSDDDAWRTPAQIKAHRETTPEGCAEAWWLPRGRLPGSVLDAILADRDPARAPTLPPSVVWTRAEVLAMAERAKSARDLEAAEALRALWLGWRVKG